MDVNGYKCVICGIGPRNGKKGICSNCGNPTKIIATCMKCHTRIDLTDRIPEELANFLCQEVTFGSALALPWCFECTEDVNERKGQTLIYRVRPKARA